MLTIDRKVQDYRRTQMLDFADFIEENAESNPEPAISFQ